MYRGRMVWKSDGTKQILSGAESGNIRLAKRVFSHGGSDGTFVDMDMRSCMCTYEPSD